MVNVKSVTLIGFKFQQYQTWITIIWTVAISFFVAIISYILINVNDLEVRTLILLGIILIFGEVIFISLHLWIHTVIERIKSDVRGL